MLQSDLIWAAHEWDDSKGSWGGHWPWLRVGHVLHWTTLGLVDQHVQHLNFAGGSVNWKMGQPSALQSGEWEHENLALFGVLHGGNGAGLLEVGSGLDLILVVVEPTYLWGEKN